MIRLTELAAIRNGGPEQVVCVRLDGDMDAVGGAVLLEELAAYRRLGIERIQLVLDGLRNPDQEACEFLAQLLAEQKELQVSTTSSFLRELLLTHGIQVVPSSADLASGTTRPWF